MISAAQATSQNEPTIDLVIFDFDGVLVDSEEIIRNALRETMRAHNLPTPDEVEILQFRGRSAGSVVRMIEQEHGVVLLGFIGEWKQGILNGIGSSVRAIPSVNDALRQINVPKCVASSGEPEKIRLSLDTAGLSRYFDDAHLYSATHVSRGKPAPDLFLYAARQQGVPPERCVVVEDSVPGIEAAIAAGMQAFGFAFEMPICELISAGATVVFRDMRSLVGLLHEHGMPHQRDLGPM